MKKISAKSKKQLGRSAKCVCTIMHVCSAVTHTAFAYESKSAYVLQGNLKVDINTLVMPVGCQGKVSAECQDVCVMICTVNPNSNVGKDHCN